MNTSPKMCAWFVILPAGPSRFARNACSLAFLLLCLLPRAAWAIALVATDGITLTRFDSAVPGIVTTVGISGMQGGEVLVGIDYRPGTGQLYGVGSTSRIYALDLLTGVATPVGSPGAFSLNGSAFGTDFNPVADRVRQVSNTEQNLRLNPFNGTLTASDMNLNPAGNIVAVAYDRNYARLIGDSTPTTLFGIDSASGMLVRIGSVDGTPNSPDGGLITNIGSLGLGTNLNESIGFDIAPPSLGETAFATITTNRTRLYSINLSTGAATLIGIIGTGAQPYLGLAVVIPPVVHAYGVTANGTLFRFAVNNPTTATTIGTLGFVPEGIDFRPGTQQLYAIDVGPTTTQLYTVNIGTATATPVGSGFPSQTGSYNLTNATIGFDFNPRSLQPDGSMRIRVVASTGSNLRLNSDLGTIVALDPALQFDPGGPNTGTPSVDAAAFTNSEFATGAAAGPSVLYVMDFGKDRLLIQDPQNNGTLKNVGPFGPTIDALAGISFDIFSFSGDDTLLGDYGFAVYKRTAVSGGAYLLYCVDLQTGATTNGRLVGGGLDFTGGFAVRPLAPGTLEFSAPTYSIGESGPAAFVSIFRKGGTDGIVTVNFTTSNGTAGPGDYTDTDLTLNFGYGVGASTVQIPITNDLHDESNETINLALSNPTGGATLGPQSTAILTITDDDTIAINLVKLTNGTDNNSAPGPGVPIGSTVTFTYSVTNPGNVPLAGVTVVDDNGTPGNPADDFNATFVGGDTNGNALLDAPETFTFTASRIATSGQYTNLAVATGAPVDGGANVQDSDIDNHFGVLPNTTPTPTPSPTASPTPTPVASTLANISTRLRVETGDNVLIGGFIITGSQAKKVIVRGIGTSLPFADRLADPTLELRDSSGALIDSNDNWVDSPNKQAIIDSTVPPSSDLESAIIATLPANGSGYTAIVRGAGDGTGIGVVEAYDLDSSVDSKLANISTRGFVQTGDNVLIAGTIILGETTQKIIVRAIGPSLPVAGNLADPILELRDGNGALIRANDNWRTGGQETEIIQSTVPPTHDFESAIVETLSGNGAAYTAIVRGVNNATGIAVVEVYALN